MIRLEEFWDACGVPVYDAKTGNRITGKEISQKRWMQAQVIRFEPRLQGVGIDVEIEMEDEE